MVKAGCCPSGCVFCCSCSCAGHAQTQTPRACVQTVLARAATLDAQTSVQSFVKRAGCSGTGHGCAWQGSLALQLSLLEDLGSRYKGHGQSTLPAGQVRSKAEIVISSPPAMSRTRNLTGSTDHLFFKVRESDSHSRKRGSSGAFAWNVGFGISGV